MMRSVLASPLLHFFLIGAAVFAFYELRNDPSPVQAEETIQLTPEMAAVLVTQFEATWRRQPSVEELQSLMDAWALEEVLVREAVSLGLDQDDAVIRQRLSHKLRFIVEAQSRDLVPDDTTLRAFLAENPDRFQLPARVSFEQVSLEPDITEQEIVEHLDALEAGAPIAQYLSMLPPQMVEITAGGVERSFGAGFADQLATLPLSEWSGPVTSGYGLHLVRVKERKPAELPLFEDVRQAVLLEWQARERERSRQETETALLSRYDVVLPDAQDLLQ